MKRKLFLCAAFAAIICACAVCAACFMFGNKKAESPVDFTIGEVTDISIEIADCVYSDGELYSTDGTEFSVDGVNWTEDTVFTGLVSNTEYTVYARACGWGNLLPGDPISKTVTTLRSQNPDLPQVDCAQERGKITLTGFTSEMEASFDNGKTYSETSLHTYTQKGKYEILVRYKQTDRAFAGEAVTFTVEYSDFFAGFGTKENPYIVTSYDELRLLNGENNYYKLLNDITFPAEECLPIPFTGYLDGNGKKLISPKIKSDETAAEFITAIFSGDVSAKDLTVENAVCTSRYNTLSDDGLGHYASILAYRASTLENCHVNGTINVTGFVNDGTERAYIGGLSCWLWNRADGCSADVTLCYDGGSAEGFKDVYSGGIAALCYDSGEITGCTAKTVFRTLGGEISLAYAGGITGNKGNFVISGCFADVEFYSNARDSFLGGISGEANDNESINGAAIVNCFATGEIVVQKPSWLSFYGECQVGGILGGSDSHSLCSIADCVSAVDISIDGTKLNVSCGGITGLGYAYGGNGYTGKRFIKNCLYTGNIAVNKDADRTNNIGAVWGYNSGSYKAENCFIKVQPSPDVDTSPSTAVEEAVYLTADWQRRNLKLDESVWEITEGELPRLK